MTRFKPLPLSALQSGSGYARPYFSMPNLVRLNSSALEVMTDLRYVAAETIRADAALEAAAQRMIVRGVHSLLVSDDREDVVGILTSRDLISTRTIESSERQGVEVGTVKVGDAMTPGEAIEVLQIDDVLHAHVGDIVETLKHSGRQHALVVEMDSLRDKSIIRGVFSASQISRQLGIAPQPDDLRQTFAQIDRTLQSWPC